MTQQELDAFRYPIGQFERPSVIDQQQLDHYFTVIENFPDRMKEEVIYLTDEQLDTPYRPEGWTIRQVVHHCADSHMNAIIRLKLALTEETPTIKPYPEARFAELNDTKSYPITPSLKILEGVHSRWIVVLRSMSKEDFNRGFFHPEKSRELKLDESTALYAWHCEHHLAHITRLKKRMGWNK